MKTEQIGGVGFMRDRWGNKSSKRLVALIGSIIGYLLAMVVIVYGLQHVIASPSVVSEVLISIVGAPFLTLVATIWENKRKD
jgi:high-affinity Fe2+/Pb2+ permease